MATESQQLGDWAAQSLPVAQQAVAEAIERHRRLGESIVIWRDGQIVTLTADEIPPQTLESSINNRQSSIE